MRCTGHLETVMNVTTSNKNGKLYKCLWKQFLSKICRDLMLAAERGSASPFGKSAQKSDVLAAVRQMGALQIDTIHVVAAAPTWCCGAGWGNTRSEWLDELLAEGTLFEYWSHAMCFLPIEDYPLYRRRMLDAAAGKDGYALWIREHPEAMEHVRAPAREHGRCARRTLRTKTVSGGWWNWKDEKHALEALLLSGDVMIARRQNFQRVYDLASACCRIGRTKTPRMGQIVNPFP